MKTHFSYRPLAFCLLALTLFGCAGERRDSIKLAHSLSTGHPVHRALEHMSERLDDLSNGALGLEIFPGEQLGSERECLELLQIGSLGMTKVSASVLESFAPLYQVLGVPYLFRDREHAFAVLDGDPGRRLLSSSEPARLRGLAFYDAGSRSFYTRERPIRHPDDLAGLKIRTQESATATRMVSALGAAATPIAWGELYTALQQGVVDGAENNPPSFHLSRHYEVARFYALDEHTSVPDVLVISTVVWNSLDDRERGWLETAARESAVFQRRIWRQAEEEALAAVEDAGVEILHPDKAPFRERAKALDVHYRQNPEVFAMIEEIRAAGAGEAR